jgi:hypothetical protein
MPLSQRDSSEKQKSAGPGKRRAGNGENSKSKNNSREIAQSAMPALKNFLIGLGVCTLIIIGVVAAVMNGESIKRTFVSASQGVSALVPKEKPKPAVAPVVSDPPPPPRDELYGDNSSLEKQKVDEKRPPARRQRVRIE